MPVDPGISIAVSGPVATATRVWSSPPAGRCATFVAKVTLALVPDGAMTLLAPAAVVTSEVHHRGNPNLSVRATAEDAPILGRADLLLTGSAHAPCGDDGHARAVPRLRVRWALMRGEDVIFDKSLDVVGDRAAKPPEAAGEPAPFKQMPLVYERAYGGIGFAPNPLGVGVSPGPDGVLHLPNVLAPPGSTVVDPAGYAPISATWSARKRRLGDLRAADLKRPEPELPGDFDLSYFQAAPADQQADYLRGDELVLMKYLHPEIPALMTSLPRLVCRGIVSVGSGGATPLAFVADTLYIDGDRRTCSVVFRARVAAPAGLPVVAAIGVAVDGQSPELPDLSTARNEVTASAPDELSVGQFGTLLIEPPTDGPAASDLVRTIEASSLGGSPPSLPFERPRPRAESERPPAPEIPGAPWTSEPNAPAPSARHARDATLVIEPSAPLAAEEDPPPTLVLPEGPPAASAPAPNVEAPAPMSSSPSSPAPPVPPSSPSSPAPPASPVPPAPPAVPPPPARPPIAPSLYRKFGKG
jgi:hypothetical protein